MPRDLEGSVATLLLLPNRFVIYEGLRKYDFIIVGGMIMLTPDTAQRELSLAAQLNPGPWEQHSISVANNARLIAAHVLHNADEDAF